MNALIEFFKHWRPIIDAYYTVGALALLAAMGLYYGFSAWRNRRSSRHTLTTTKPYNWKDGDIIKISGSVGGRLDGEWRVGIDPGSDP